jgi:lysophospholipid acyltransferase (LPLAT)-like uncharacterized protein
MGANMKRFIYKYILPYLGLFLIKALSATYRIRVINEEIEKSIYERGEVPIYCSWHQRFFSGFGFFPKRHPLAIMVSQSRDGDFGSRMIEIMGVHTARGSSSRGGGEALQDLIGYIEKGIPAGHIVDGPRGPAGRIKPGLIKLAQYSGMPILPAIISPEKKWVFKSWDRFMIPKPFSRIIIRFDEETYVPDELDSDKFEEIRSEIEDRLYLLYKETDEIWDKK